MPDDKVAIAFINKCWGVRGEVIAQSLTRFPQRFKKLKVVRISGVGLKLDLTVEWSKKHGGKIILKFEEISNRNEAERLKNSYVEIEKSEIYKLPAYEYYVFQMVGLEVTDSEDKIIGTVADVWENPANDIIVVRSEKGVLLVPGVKEVVKKVDLKNNRMEVNLLPGMEFEAE